MKNAQQDMRRPAFSDRPHDELHRMIGELENEAITVMHLMDAAKALIEDVSTTNPAGAVLDQVYSIVVVASRIAREAKERCNDVL